MHSKTIMHSSMHNTTNYKEPATQDHTSYSKGQDITQTVMHTHCQPQTTKTSQKSTSTCQQQPSRTMQRITQHPKTHLFIATLHGGSSGMLQLLVRSDVLFCSFVLFYSVHIIVLAFCSGLVVCCMLMYLGLGSGSSLWPRGIL